MLDKFVVTTKRFIERQREFSKINAHIPNFTWSYGPDAHEYSRIDVIRNQLSNKVSPEISWRPSLICNAISHYKLIEKCAEGNKVMTIMEDDAVLVTDFDSKATSLIDKLPNRNFDLIQWGWNWDSFVYVRNQNGESQKIDWSSKYLKVQPQNFRDEETLSNLKPLLLSFGIHCYTITPQGAQKLLKLYPIIEDIFVDSVDITGIAFPSETIDGAFNAFYPSMEAYVSIAPLSYAMNDKQNSLL